MQPPGEDSRQASTRRQLSKPSSVHHAAKTLPAVSGSTHADHHHDIHAECDGTGRGPTLKSCSAPKRRMADSSSLPNICLADAAEVRGSRTVRPLVSMRWMTRWSSTIFCFARSRMSSSTLPLVRNLRCNFKPVSHQGRGQAGFQQTCTCQSLLL